jgi:hypothetical protein
MYTTHRHTIGTKVFEYFAMKQNSDLTEGRGGMRTVSRWATAEDAHKAAHKGGVMGIGDGEVWYVTINYCGGGDYDEPCDYICEVESRIYDGQKWIDVRFDPRANDPEFQEYLRLKKIYE